MVGPGYKAVCDKYIQGGCDTISLLQEADIWLFGSDFVLDFPRPTRPNVVYIGGFRCKPAQPLSAELEEFVESAGEHGVIIMILDTFVNVLPDDMAEEIARVFAKMPQKVIWRNIGERPSTLGSNTLIVAWMPQKDPLGHPRTKVFVAHGGTNGAQEAIWTYRCNQLVSLQGNHGATATSSDTVACKCCGASKLEQHMHTRESLQTMSLSA
ncbi:unnamed protein product [Lota lota]